MRLHGAGGLEHSVGGAHVAEGVRRVKAKRPALFVGQGGLCQQQNLAALLPVGKEDGRKREAVLLKEHGENIRRDLLRDRLLAASLRDPQPVGIDEERGERRGEAEAVEVRRRVLFLCSVPIIGGFPGMHKDNLSVSSEKNALSGAEGSAILSVFIGSVEKHSLFSLRKKGKTQKPFLKCKKCAIAHFALPPYNEDKAPSRTEDMRNNVEEAPPL